MSEGKGEKKWLIVSALMLKKGANWWLVCYFCDDYLEKLFATLLKTVLAWNAIKYKLKCGKLWVGISCA